MAACLLGRDHESIQLILEENDRDEYARRRENRLAKADNMDERMCLF
jgi:hypothetical protein